MPGTGRGADIMSELPKIETEGEGIVFGRVLGGGRFLKTLQCWHDSSMVVVKAYSKRDGSPSLREYGERLEGIRQRLSGITHPNVLPFVWFPETQRAAFLVRAYVHSSLSQRMTTRPFLTVQERKWLTFQLLTALQQCESVGLGTATASLRACVACPQIGSLLPLQEPVLNISLNRH